MKNKYIFPLLLLFASETFAQDVFFTSTNQSLIYQNPSFAGTNGFIRNQTIYRNQWPNIWYPNYVTYMNSFDAYVKPMKAGMALTAMVDDNGNGTLKTSWFSYAYAQHIAFKGSGLKLIPSLQFTYLQLTLDKTKLNFGDPVIARYGRYWTDMTGPVPIASKKNISFSSGMLALYKNFTFGVTAFNFNQPDIGLLGAYQLPARICVYTSWHKEINEDGAMQVTASYNNQGNWHRWQISPTLFYKKMMMNIGLSDAYGPGFNAETYGRLAFTGMGIRLKRMSLFYQYGLSFSRLSGGTAGSHELSLSFHFKSKKDTLSYRQPELW